MKPTKHQQLAIDLEGNSLLVSAAAGSGKTSVLTQRVIKKLTDSKNPVSADSLMILTFTEAAAAEMRSRIMKGIRKLVKEQPDNSFLRRQLMLLPSARISTIHSACLNIVRTNFQLLDIDPQFTIGDENKLELMKITELDDYLEEVYANALTDSKVADVIEYFAKGKTDTSLSGAVYSTSKALSKQPYEKEFIDYVCNITAEQSMDSVIDHLILQTEDIISRYEKLIEDAAEFEKAVNVYSDERDFVCLVKKYLKEKNIDKVYELLDGYKFVSHPKRKGDVPTKIWNLYKDTRNEQKERVISIKDDYIYAEPCTLLNDRKAELEVIKTFLDICNTFNERLADKRKKQRMLSFDDIEKYALELLIAGFENGKPVKTALAKELSENIDEIIVDEYQDCNRIQNLIFSALSKDDTNIFMVGDIKQSIYRFRGAQPQVFLEKQLMSVPVNEYAPLTVPSRVDLSRNFRSNERILGFVNSVFKPIMTGECGGIDYSDGHSLYPNPDAPKSKSDVEVHILVSANGRATNKASKMEAEAKYVADKISKLLESGKVFDGENKTYRPVAPSDIAVLMRAPKRDGAIFEEAFINAKIPFVNNNPSENYLETAEVRSVLAYLQVINNPYEDIPLVTLMYSDFFSFAPQELAQIRANSKNALFYDAVKAYAEKDAKTASFVKTLDYLRTLSLTTDVYGLISAVYESSGILLKLSEKEKGDEMKANLMHLLDYAEGFERDRYRGLYAFINYILKLTENADSIPAARLKKTGGSVNIMSIHGSKGLEFPIVFFVCAGNDIQSKGVPDIMLDDELGVGGYIRDNQKHRNFSSFTRNLILSKDREQNQNEAMRLMYVAMTRPINSLYITGVMSENSLERAVNSVYMCSAKPKKYDVSSSPSYIKWMLYSLMKTKQAENLCTFCGVPCDLCTSDGFADVFVENVTDIETWQQPLPEKTVKSTLTADKVKEFVSREYKYACDTLLPSKLSVSEIKGMRRAEEDVEQSFKKRSFFKKPSFLNRVSGTDRGNATHRFLQFCDFEKITDMNSLLAEKQRLVDFEFITEKEAEFVDCEKILRFLLSDTMKELGQFGKCFKEQRFLFTLPAKEITDTDSESEIIVQEYLTAFISKMAKRLYLIIKQTWLTICKPLQTDTRHSLKCTKKQ